MNKAKERLCPYLIITRKYNTETLEITTQEFYDCAEEKCPFWNEQKNDCERIQK